MTELPDLVPAELRQSWVDRGWCPNSDLYTLFHAGVAAHPERPAVIDDDGPCDYAALDDLALRWAGVLLDAGLGIGDIIGIQLPNGRHAVAAELGVAAIGAVALPFPVDRGQPDTLSLLGRSGARAHVAGGPRPDPPASRAALAPANLGDPVPRHRLPAHIDYRCAARILVSSGSEAEPKMIAYSHQAMAGGRGNYLRALHTSPDPMRNLVLVPLSSSFGSLGVVTLTAGGTLLVRSSFAADTALRTITEHRPTILFAVPTMLRRMAECPAAAGENLRSLARVVSSGAALPAATADACMARFGRPVTNVYGSADGVNCHTGNLGRTGPAPVGCVGRPDPAVAEIRIVDAAGEPVPAGQDGEICALGPMTPMCYLNSPELNARYRLSGGWVRTGDRGVLDAAGRLHVLSRIKQVIIRGGENISPAEIERQLGAHPAIAEVACVPVLDPDLGERVCACVAFRPRADPLGLAALNGFLRHDRGMSQRKLPEFLLVLPELPLGPTGKICRRTLTRLAAGQASVRCH
ncbi:MAG TPA: fatty acid--CoA ligase family protein [Pseudonocardiaceae bacterium]|nr:fatty acid--CoA ligase family protein [Pseudonocardiaceae bacterium]